VPTTKVKPDPKQPPREEPRPLPPPVPVPQGSKDKDDKRLYVVRLQAQGGGLEESVTISQAVPVTVAQGIAELEELKKKIGKKETETSSIGYSSRRRDPEGHQFPVRRCSWFA
jgi:hypothetical protein